MISSSRLAWLQLCRQKVRLVVAIAGVSFAVLLMMMQVGFMDALYRSAINLHRHLAADLVLLDPAYSTLPHPTRFPERRLQQARAIPGVAAVIPVHTDIAQWKHPVDASMHGIFVIGIDPARQPFIPGPLTRLARRIRYPDVVAFDEHSRPEYGVVPAALHANTPLTTEVNRREIEVTSLFDLGTSFGIDGNLITSDLNFRRLFPAYPKGAVSIGLVRLRPGTDAAAVRDALDAYLPNDVQVLTLQQFEDMEVQYWATKTPIGFVFTFGVIMGIVVGMIIVYQILFTDVAEHLAEYATLKAMGRTNRYLSRVVVAEATLLAVSGFVPGLAVSWWLYRLTHIATKLPMEVGLGRALVVLGLTIVMCWASGLLAIRKLRTADPAEVF